MFVPISRSSIPIFCCLVAMAPGWTDSLSGQEQGSSTDRLSEWKITRHESLASLRGLMVVDDQVVWASGSKGTVLRSIDGAATWTVVGPVGADELDFRDVHAFDARNAVIATAGTPARIYRTNNGGQSWEIVFDDERPAAFFDAMAFSDDQKGIVFSDPIDGRLLIVRTSDGGRNWTELNRNQQPATLSGEAGFAASGTCLCVIDENVFIGLGGNRQDGEPEHARILKSSDHGESWIAIDTPMNTGEASGVFSIAFANRDHGVAVGGTYNNAEDGFSNICITEDGGQTWFRPESTPRGYRSCVTVQRTTTGVRFVAVSRVGSDYSDDFGRTWNPLDDEIFYAADFSSKRGVAVGPDGRIGVWNIE